MTFKYGDKVLVKDTEHTRRIAPETIGRVAIITSSDSGNCYLLNFNQWSMNFYSEDIELYKKTLNDLQVGDVLVNAADNEATVLGKCGRVVFVSKLNEPAKHSCGYTVEELEEKGMKIKEAKPEVTEVTMDEVAKKFGCSVESFKIKKE